MDRSLSGILLLAAALAAPVNAASAADPAWLPLSRSELTEILAGGNADPGSATRSVDELLREREAAASGGAETAKPGGGWLEAEAARLAPDTLWLLAGPKIPYRVIMAGSGERVHSLRIWVPVVNHSQPQAKQSFEAVTALFTTLYPDWPEARDWYGDSLLAAWGNHPLARKTPLENPDHVFIRHSAEGVTSTTFGVPPDIAIYDITVRERCIAVSAQGNPFERAIC